MTDEKPDEGAGGADQTQEFKLGADEELRFEVENIKGQTITVVVRSFIHFCNSSKIMPNTDV